MRFWNCLAVTFVIMFLHTVVSAQSDWTFQKEKDGIKLSSRRSATSSFNDVRVELDVPGTIHQLAAILEDVPRYSEWAYATKKSVLVKQLGPGKLIYYSEIEVPWPATNRYFYAGFELKTDLQNQTLQLEAASIPGYGPVPADLVSVPYTKGSWHATTLSPKSIHIDYVLELNPGGSLPAWVINLFTTKGPLETFENIKRKMTSLNPAN
jgi:hypothetical protein